MCENADFALGIEAFLTFNTSWKIVCDTAASRGDTKLGIGIVINDSDISECHSNLLSQNL
jgi:hypothetical protein